MSDDAIRRRDFLSVANTVAVAVTSGMVAAEGQTTQPAATRAADLVLRNGNVITITSDAGSTIARAIAIVGDRIIAVGSDASMKPHTWTPAGFAFSWIYRDKGRCSTRLSTLRPGGLSRAFG
jgi:hypothetical protein